MSNETETARGCCWRRPRYFSGRRAGTRRREAWSPSTSRCCSASTEDGRPLFALDGDDAEGDGLPGTTLGLRELASELPAHELGLVAYAAALLNWHRRHGFCAVCGHATEIADGGHERRCPSCGAHHFPRTDPVVIMRVTRGDQLLLGHKPEWPARRYSVLAGFVEPGETLEQAVRREVLEESGIEVEGVGYVASQPWPFPSSLMLGFEATARPGREPAVGDDELEDVRWFSRERGARPRRAARTSCCCHRPSRSPGG